MVTPFKKDLSIDYGALERLVRWYETERVDGFFAVAQSSAMFELSLDERVELARKVREFAPSELPVVASGHVSDTLDGQLEELTRIAGTGVDTLVLLTNRFAAPNEDESVWKKNMEKLLARLPEEISLGLYECPYPYKRLISEDILKWIINTGRFGFVKDTCCSPSMIKMRGALAEGSGVKLFNANAPTLLFSLRNGYSGYSGIMTNFHAGLYSWLYRNWRSMEEKAEKLQRYLSVASLIENYGYPVNAKYALNLMGVNMELVCRRSDMRYYEFSEYDKFLVDLFMEESREVSREYL